MFEQQSLHCFLLWLTQDKRELQSSHGTCAKSHSEAYFVLPSSIQRGKEEYKLAPTSDGKEKKSKKKGKGEKDMDELKKEVDLVSTQIKASLLLS